MVEGDHAFLLPLPLFCIVLIISAPLLLWNQHFVHQRLEIYRRVLHIPPPSQLNTQLDTFPIGSINNQPVTAIGSQNRHRTSSTAPRGRNPSNISVINCRPRREEHEFGMNILLANTQSLAPKIDEVRSVMLNVKPDLGFFTETWLS